MRKLGGKPHQKRRKGTGAGEELLCQVARGANAWAVSVGGSRVLDYGMWGGNRPGLPPDFAREVNGSGNGSP